MKKKGVVMQVAVVCAVVSILGLMTVILGVAGTSSAAESSVQDGKGGCEYRATPAGGCGIVAMLFALTTQIVATAATGCCGCCRTFGTPTIIGKRITTIVLSTVSWVLAIIAVILFFVGALATIDVIGLGDMSPDGTCDSPAVKLFAAATVLILIATVFQIISYILFQTMAAKSLPKEQSGILLGQPPVPPNASAPTAPAVEAGASAPLPPTVSSGGSADPTSKV